MSYTLPNYRPESEVTQTTCGMFLQAFDYVHGRLLTRLEGLTDDEYFWQPVPGCWTVRPSTHGVYVMDRPTPPEPDPPPVTTIGWRICHIGADVLKGFAASLQSGQPCEPEVSAWPGSAADGIRFLEDGYAEWHEALASLTDDVMWKELGLAWGPFGSDSTADLVLHVFDELVHHGAEVGVLRDLYRAGLR